MASQTSIVAKQVRLMEWAEQIRDCQNRPREMDVAAWCAQQSIAAGYGDGSFGGGDIVTREQLAVFLWRYAQYAGLELAAGVLDIYPDRDGIHTWAREGMAHAVGAGLITGRDGNRLDPGGPASRAQLAVILRRLTTPAVG